MRLIIICLFSCGLYSSIGQCLCGYLTVDFYIEGVQLSKKDFGYKVSGEGSLNRFNTPELKGDTLSFSYATNGGLDTMAIRLKDKKGEVPMTIFLSHIEYDTPYYLLFTNFQSGEYSIDFQQLVSSADDSSSDSAIISSNGNQFIRTPSRNIRTSTDRFSFKTIELRKNQLKSKQ